MDNAVKKDEFEGNQSCKVSGSESIPSSADSCNLNGVKSSIDQDTSCDKVEDEKSDDEYSDAKDTCNETDVVDENIELDDEDLKSSHEGLSETELQKLKEAAAALKNEGNDSFKKADYAEAILLYTRALNSCPLVFQTDRSVLYANRAAAKINLDRKEEAVLDCNKALELDPNYMKALVRRAQLHRKLENLDLCYADYQKIMELDRNNEEARYACATLPAEIAEKNEKLKNEMFGKLKELGNLCLRPFGLSTDNFKVEQDPNSGGYSINFQNKQ